MSEPTTTDVLAERIEGLKTFIGVKFDENKIDHDSLANRQDHTNGSIGDALRDIEKMKKDYNWYKGFLFAIYILVVPVIVYVAGVLLANTLTKQVYASPQHANR